MDDNKKDDENNKDDANNKDDNKKEDENNKDDANNKDDNKKDDVKDDVVTFSPGAGEEHMGGVVPDIERCGILGGQCAVYRLCAVCSVQCALCSFQCAMYSVQCAVHVNKQFNISISLIFLTCCMHDVH